VELKSQTPPAGNEFPPGTGTIDTAHIECVDCHNPHQVVRTNRLQGMKGITFDNQVIDATASVMNRPYVYEVCFRCHGNSYTEIFSGDRFPQDTTYRSNPLAGVTNAKFSLAGFSNKRLEFATYGGASQERAGGTDASYLPGVGPGVHKSYHPVVAGGRNATAALTKQLAVWSSQFGTPSAETITIQCTDCHNSDYYDAYTDPLTGAVRTQPDARFLGPITESNAVRPGDKLNTGIAQDYDVERSQHPIGPHGSNNIRILRAPYNTDVANPSRNFRTDGFNAPVWPGFPGQTSHWDNFLLCFQCHDRRAFDPVLNPTEVQDASWTNFFGVPAHPDDNTLNGAIVGNLQLSWESNLHMYHLQRTGALCHECHYNVHSNVEAQNTIYGDGTGCIGGTPGCPAGLPPDDEDGITDGVSDTHLINFAPPGPTLYSGEKRCDDARVLTAEDVACTTGVFTLDQRRNPNPRLSGSNQTDPQTYADTPKANVFEAVEGVTATLPVWYYTLTESTDDGAAPPRPQFPVFRCNLRCHGVVMSTCFYIGNADPTRTINKRMNVDNLGGTDTWCAGGVQQIAPISVGSAPQQIKEFLAQFNTLTSGKLAEETRRTVELAAEKSPHKAAK
jgi:hypothetical protein